MFEIYFIITILLTIQNLTGILLNKWINMFIISSLLTIQSYIFLTDLFVQPPSNFHIIGTTFIMMIPVIPMIWFFIVK